MHVNQLDFRSQRKNYIQITHVQLYNVNKMLNYLQKSRFGGFLRKPIMVRSVSWEGLEITWSPVSSMVRERLNKGKFCKGLNFGFIPTMGLKLPDKGWVRGEYGLFLGANSLQTSPLQEISTAEDGRGLEVRQDLNLPSREMFGGQMRPPK